MKQIEITNIKKNPAGYVEASVTMRFVLPNILLNNNVPLPNAGQIIASYGDYSLETLPDTSIVINHPDIISLSGNATLTQFKNALIAKYTQINTAISGLTLKPFDTLVGSYYDGSTWI